MAVRKLQLIEQLMGVVNPDKLERLENFFKEEIKDVWDELPSSVQNKIEKSREESLNSQTISHEEVMLGAKSRYKLS